MQIGREAVTQADFVCRLISARFQSLLLAIVQDMLALGAQTVDSAIITRLGKPADSMSVPL